MCKTIQLTDISMFMIIISHLGHTLPVGALRSVKTVQLTGVRTFIIIMIIISHLGHEVPIGLLDV
jgi:hypothetical protein